MGKYDNLEKIHRELVKYPIYLHPDERRNYTQQELENIQRRDFETRLLITNTPVAGDSVFLSTHHTDNAKHASHLNYVRDYLKATHSTKNWTCAKATLTTLLTMCFQLNQSDYCTFATSMASGLSKNAENTLFEITDLFIRDQKDVHTVRWKFCLLMDVIFSKMSTKKFLLDDKSCNIFRLIYCDTHYRSQKRTLFIAFFSFTLQICLTLYVILQNVSTPSEDYFKHMTMLPLAIFTLTYSFIVAIPTIKDTQQAYETLFKGIGLLQLMDAIVNILIPLLLAVSGFLVILCQDNFIDAVLNVTALLFIPEIDDQLPDILGLQEEDIIRNFLIAQSLKDYDEILKMDESDLNPVLLKRKKVVCRLQFGDYYITNLAEQGIDAQNGEAFQPYQVTSSESDNGHQIDPSTMVTPQCLLRKIEWNYTTGFPYTTARRIGRLKLTKIDGSVVFIERKKDPTGVVGINDETHILEGVYIITTFQMSEDVIKLRMCGSFNPENFIEAFEYYSLWDLDDHAKEAIQDLVKEQESGKASDDDDDDDGTDLRNGGYSKIRMRRTQSNKSSRKLVDRTKSFKRSGRRKSSVILNRNSPSSKSFRTSKRKNN